VLGIPDKSPKRAPLILSQPPAVTAAKPSPPADDNGNGKGWITVTQAAALLIRDVPSLDLPKARSRISIAAGRNEFTLDGERKERRIEPVSFDAWRLKQRDRDLDEEDDEQVA